MSAKRKPKSALPVSCSFIIPRSEIQNHFSKYLYLIQRSRSFRFKEKAITHIFINNALNEMHLDFLIKIFNRGGGGLTEKQRTSKQEDTSISVPYVFL